MRRTSTTIQPYDRATGTELSPEQQEACQANYATIKAFIDQLEAQSSVPLPWSRKIIRCPTVELIESIDAVATSIRQRLAGETIDWDGSDTGQGAVVSESPSEGSGLHTPSAEISQLYQQAVNLLHEFVSRFSAVSEPLLEGYASSRLIVAPPDNTAPAVFAPGSQSNSSDASAAFSNPALSRTSYMASDSSKTDLSAALDDIPFSSHILGEQLEEEVAAVVEPSATNDVPPEIPVVKQKATHDWVLEYLRGGWLANSPIASSSPTTSPTFPMAADSSPASSLRILQRTDSEEMSADGDDHTSRPLGSIPATTRKIRRGRPIPTVASRIIGKSAFEIHEYSAESGAEFFKTPKSIISGGTLYCTPDSGGTGLNPAMQVKQTSAWNKYLREKGLIPNPFEEMDWSGRGQHAEFEAAEEDQIPLALEKTLGHSATAVVESVRCRRIRLARKSVEISRLRKRLTKEDAIKEVEHLQRLKHPHIIRVVGTYTLPRQLSILLYPVAEYTLDIFLDSIHDEIEPLERTTRLYSISTFLRCLAKALAYIHENAMKHMDIKPKNLLVRDMRSSTICNQGYYKIYIADFGIARSYLSVDDCNTDTPTAYTKMYAAPEVVAQEQRDQKADIFSLGAVFAEMLAVLANEESEVPNLYRLQDLRESLTDRSYQANIEFVQTFIKMLSITSYGFESDSVHSPIAELVALMLSEDPAGRPSAATVVNNIPFLAFCCDVNGGPEPFEAADRPMSTRQLYDRSMEITEAAFKYFRCKVDGCVKVYWSREKLRYHELNGHGETLIASDRGSKVLNMEQSDLGTVLPDRTSKPSRGYDKALHKELTHSLRWS